MMCILALHIRALLMKSGLHSSLKPCECAHLVEDLLQKGGAHAVGQVSIGRVRQEELSLSLQSRRDVFPPINVLLTAVHHPDVT